MGIFATKAENFWGGCGVDMGIFASKAENFWGSCGVDMGIEGSGVTLHEV